MSKRKQRGVAYADAMRMALALASLGSMVWFDFLTIDRMRNAEHKDTCKANLQHLGRALEAYVPTNNGRFPTMPVFPMKEAPNRLNMLKPDAPGNLIALLRNAIRDTDIFTCPSAPDALQQWDLNYLWNESLNGRVRSTLSPTELAATWMLCDLEAIYAELPPVYLATQQMTLDMVPAPHVRGYNILYADGKVRWSAMPPRIRITNFPKLPAGGSGFGNPGGGSGGSGSGS